MNIVAIGRGNFGASLAKILTSPGHDVLGVDQDLARVEYFKDTVANAICLDATDPHALRLLPIKEADVFKENDTLIMAGEIRDIKRFLQE